MANLIYVADPMCSWCYGFGPEIGALASEFPELPVHIIVGGLRAYNTTPMDCGLKARLLEHWKHVKQASGLPFTSEVLGREGFIYDTEPACRAVVTARMLAPHVRLLPVFASLQRAFYADGKDVTQGDVLAEVSAHALTDAGFPADAQEFLAAWSGPAAVDATRGDFGIVQQLRITGFPTLLLQDKAQLKLVAAGYTKREELGARVRKLMQ